MAAATAIPAEVATATRTVMAEAEVMVAQQMATLERAHMAVVASEVTPATRCPI